LKNILTRSITGILFVTIFLSSILFSEYTFVALFLFIIVTAMFEFYRTALIERVRTQTYYGVFVGVVVFVLNYLYAKQLIEASIFLIIIPLFMFIFIFEIYSNNKRPFSNIAYTILGIIYISVPFSLFNYMIFEIQKVVPEVINTEYEQIVANIQSLEVKNITLNYTPKVVLVFFIFQWAYDTFAYLFGISLGRTRLYESISPKKSWEGAIGGAISTIGIAYLISQYFDVMPTIHLMVVAAIIVVFGTYGDLVESLYKRSLCIKDSGKMLPGHGGILDRFDSTLMAAPFVFVYLQLI
jgi:phosphatidate cytidylyltransferase